MSSSPVWHSTTFRVLSLTDSINFYVTHFNMQVVHKTDTSAALVTSRNNEDPKPIFYQCKGVSLCLREEANLQAINNGNVEPNRGFGHIAFNCNDVYQVCAKLAEAGVKFQKKPDEGRMKGLAFALDPNNYWIEIIGRGESIMPEPFNLSQTMIRVKDPEKSLAFYRDLLEMTVVRHMPMSDFSNYFLTSLLYANVQPKEAESGRDFVHKLWTPCLELTHNHGTENQRDFKYHNGNTNGKALKGFSNLTFAVTDLEAFLKKAESFFQTHQLGDFQKSEVEHKLFKECIRITDPDGYHVVLVDRRNIN